MFCLAVGGGAEDTVRTLGGQILTEVTLWRDKYWSESE